jgi:hypothetical protein
MHGKQHLIHRYGEGYENSAGSETPSMYRRHLARESGGPAFDLYRFHKGTHGESQGGTVMVNGCRESDNLIVRAGQHVDQEG